MCGQIFDVKVMPIKVELEDQTGWKRACGDPNFSLIIYVMVRSLCPCMQSAIVNVFEEAKIIPFSYVELLVP